MIRRAIQGLASLRLTVILMTLAMVLIFVGTIAQTRIGVWRAVDSYFRAPIAWVDPGMFVPGDSGEDLGVRFPIPGGLTIAALMVINLLAAHVTRFKATRKRVGVLALHAGLIVLLAGEFVTGFLAEEGLMSIDEQSSSSYIEDVRDVELAVIDPSDPERDRVVSIPGALLAEADRNGETISDSRLPFTVEVDRWMPNAALFHAHESTPASMGIGLEARAEPRPQVTGVEGAQTDTPAAYVTLRRDGQRLGTWLVSAALLDAQRVGVDGQAYGLSLRYRRTYLPFALHLNDFRHDIFAGTSIAKNFSSDVRIVDPRPRDRP